MLECFVKILWYRITILQNHYHFLLTLFCLISQPPCLVHKDDTPEDLSLTKLLTVRLWQDLRKEEEWMPRISPPNLKLIIPLPPRLRGSSTSVATTATTTTAPFFPTSLILLLHAPLYYNEWCKQQWRKTERSVKWSRDLNVWNCGPKITDPSIWMVQLSPPQQLPFHCHCDPFTTLPTAPSPTIWVFCCCSWWWKGCMWW